VIPSWQNVDDLLKQACDILQALQQKAVTLGDPAYEAQVAPLEIMLTQVRGEIESSPVVLSPPQTPGEATWNPKSDKEKVAQYQKLRWTVGLLRSMNLDEIAEGWCYFIGFAVLLVFLAVVYLGLHSWFPKVKSADSRVEKLVSQMDTSIQGLTTVKSQLKDLSGRLQSALQGIDLTSDTKSLLNAVQQDINAARIDETETFSRLQATLVSELETPRSGTKVEASKVNEVRGWLRQMDTSIQGLKTAKSQLKDLSAKLQSELQGMADVRDLLTAVQSDISRIDETETFSKFRATLVSELETLRSGAKGTDAGVTEVASLLSQMDSAIQKLKAAGQAQNPPASPPGQTPEAQNQLSSLANTLQNKLLGIGLTFQTLRLLGEVQGEIVTGRIKETTETFSNFRKNLLPELESLSVGYFWTTTPRRWIEIAWWAEFGTLVGLLYYIAGLLGTGLFRVEETSMFWTEVCIAPLVVIVVFFLFSYTGITAIQLSEVSIIVTLGVAFILGFAIRRTIGFLDIIKSGPKMDVVLITVIKHLAINKDIKNHT
jgi:hypothetical protein